MQVTLIARAGQTTNLTASLHSAVKWFRDGILMRRGCEEGAWLGWRVVPRGMLNHDKVINTVKYFQEK